MTEIDHTYWYLCRAAGMMAYLLLFASVALGLTMTGGALDRTLPRHRVYDLHRFLSLLALGLTVFHVLVVLPDEYVGFTPMELLAPFASPYRPLYTGIGVLSLYLSAAIVLTFYLRSLVPYRAWRLLHYSTFAAFVMALVHGIGAGTDTEAAWAQYLYAGTGLVAFNLLAYRLLNGSARSGVDLRPGPTTLPPSRRPEEAAP